MEEVLDIDGGMARPGGLRLGGGDGLLGILGKFIEVHVYIIEQIFGVSEKKKRRRRRGRSQIPKNVGMTMGGVRRPASAGLLLTQRTPTLLRS